MGARRACSYSFSRIHETPSSMCPRGLLGSSATTAWKSSIAALTWPASASRMALSRRLVVAVRRGARLLPRIRLGAAHDRRAERAALAELLGAGPPADQGRMVKGSQKSGTQGVP